jgi:hypothetical protein
MGSVWLAIPTTSGLNIMVTGKVDPGANEYCPAPVTMNGEPSDPTFTAREEVLLAFLMFTVRVVAGIPTPRAGNRTAAGTLNTPPVGSDAGVGVGVGASVGVGVGIVVAVEVTVAVGSIVGVALAVNVWVGVPVAVAVASIV